MWKITATSAAGILLVSTVLAAAPGRKPWTMTRVLDQGSLVAMTNSERVIGILQTATGDRPFLWHKGDFTYLPPSFIPLDVNNGSRVVGVDRPSPFADRVVMWHHGTMTELWIGSSKYAYDDAPTLGINNLGQVVGSDGLRPMLWTDGTAVALPFGVHSTAADINDDGLIVGWLEQSKSFSPTCHGLCELPFAWDSVTSSLRTLQLPPLPTPPASGVRRTRAVAVNDFGQVVGWTTGSDATNPHAVLWDAAGIPTMLVPGALYSVPTAINERGQVVGYASDGTQSGAFVWEDGVLTVLGVDAIPVDINNRGEIIGNAAGGGVLWTR